MSGVSSIKNLYVHFPFCRRKCTYCVLHSKAGASSEEKSAYVSRLCGALKTMQRDAVLKFDTIYFGGGSPGLCNLSPFLEVLTGCKNEGCEFTVELHPNDVSRPLLQSLKAGGVTRISMGVQSVEDATLRHMGRGYDFSGAENAFFTIKEYFDNAGIDLIVGYPEHSENCFEKVLSPRWAKIEKWGIKHCSVYSLIWEENSILEKLSNLGKLTSLSVPDDENVLNKISVIARYLKEIGLNRYEISNYAVPGFECRHNLSVWRGEDYYGLGDGAYGRINLLRTKNFWGQSLQNPSDGNVEKVSEKADKLERTIFKLRTFEGLDAAGHPQWLPSLERFRKEGLLLKPDEKCHVYRLTERGTEVCDSILAELV